jgi:hypothetical protein
VAISTPALLDCDESDMMRSEALDVLAAASLRLKSRLDDELESLTLDVWFVEMLAFTLLSELSILDEEFDSDRLDV